MSSTLVLEAASELFICAGNHLHTYCMKGKYYNEGTRVRWEQHHHLLCAQEFIVLQA